MHVVKGGTIASKKERVLWHIYFLEIIVIIITLVIFLIIIILLEKIFSPFLGSESNNEEPISLIKKIMAMGTKHIEKFTLLQQIMILQYLLLI